MIQNSQLFWSALRGQEVRPLTSRKEEGKQEDDSEGSFAAARVAPFGGAGAGVEHGLLQLGGLRTRIAYGNRCFHGWFSSG